MKTNRYILSLLLLVVSAFNLTPANAQQNQYAIYNYRNDGDFNAWLNIDVDSITYSCIDTFGVEHDEVVVQEVWTPDSVYRIPISAIDSLGFRAPETVMKSNVFIIRESHVPYTLDVDSLSIVFDSTIPSSMLPSIGQVVVSETFEDPYEEGFVGRVVKINNLGNSIEIICEDATLFDIYDQLIAVGKFESVEESSQNSKKQLPKRILGFGDIDKSGEYTFEIGKLKLKHDKFEWVSAEYTPEIKFEYILYIHKDDPIHVKFLISGKHDFALNVDYKVLEKLSTESKDEIWICDVPLPYFYGFKPIFKVGLFYKVGGKAHVTGKIPVTISHGLGFEYHGSGLDISNVNILKSFDMNFGEPELDLKIDGYIAGGLCADLGVKFLHKKLASIEAILKMGPKLTTTFDLSANDIVNDPSAYSILKNTKLKADFDIGIDAKYRILKKQARILPGKGWPGVKNVNQYEREEDYPKGEISWSWNLFDCYILPEFTHSFSSYNNQQAVFSTTASRELFFPVKIGAQIEKNGKFETLMQPNSYWSEHFDAKTRTFDTQFDDIALGNTYTSKPVVEILGCRLSASPAAKVNTDIKQLSLKEGTQGTVTIGDGKTTFAVRSDNPKIATCSIDKKDNSKMIVNAIKQGVATIILTDTKKNESSMLQVAVVDKNTTDLTLSVTELDLYTESSASVLITSGSGNYTVESSNSEVATAECTDNTILVMAHTVGTATITVTDAESGLTAKIDVTVTEEATDDLALSETTVSMKPNETAEVAITSGSGSYSLENSNAEVAVAAISNGNKISIAALKAGTATITVTDTKTKQTATIAVTVTDGTDVILPQDGLVAYYPFNGNANDESGNGNHGTVNGNVELTSDRFGHSNSAYRFPGAAFNYISIPDNETLHCSTFTLNAWVYTDAEDYGSGYLICKGRDIINGSYRLCVRNVGAQNLYNGDNDAFMEGIPQVGVWHMVTGTVEGDKAKFYLDGILMDERKLSYSFTYGNSDPMALGMHYYSGVPSYWAYPFLGILDDVRIYNRVLDASEIKSLYREQ